MPTRSIIDLFMSAPVSGSSTGLTGTYPVGISNRRGSPRFRRGLIVHVQRVLGRSSCAPPPLPPLPSSGSSSSSLEPGGYSLSAGAGTKESTSSIQRLRGSVNIHDGERTFDAFKVDKVVISAVCGNRRASVFKEAPAVLDTPNSVSTFLAAAPTHCVINTHFARTQSVFRLPYLDIVARHQPVVEGTTHVNLKQPSIASVNGLYLVSATGGQTCTSLNWSDWSVVNAPWFLSRPAWALG